MGCQKCSKIHDGDGCPTLNTLTETVFKWVNGMTRDVFSVQPPLCNAVPV